MCCRTTRVSFAFYGLLPLPRDAAFQTKVAEDTLREGDLKERIKGQPLFQPSGCAQVVMPKACKENIYHLATHRKLQLAVSAIPYISRFHTSSRDKHTQRDLQISAS